MNQSWHGQEAHQSSRHSGRRLPWILAAVVTPTVFCFIAQHNHAAFAGENDMPGSDRTCARVPAEDIALLERVSQAYQHVAQVVRPSVVSITTLSPRRSTHEAGDDRVRDEATQSRNYSMSSGSGVIFDDRGHIVTSNHVIDDATRVDVQLYDGRTYRANIVGRDKMTDTALLKIDAPRLQPATFGDSDLLDVGHMVVAVGSPFKLAQTVSHGMVSAKGRTGVNLSIDYQNFIQTDVPINPGNSGGALVNIRGEVIGINTAIATESGSFAGVAFATPSNIVVSIAKRLMTGHPIVRGFLGVEIGTLDPDVVDQYRRSGTLSSEDAVVIGRVETDGPADKGGLRRNDVVLQVDGKRIHSVSELQITIAGLTPGQHSAFTVLRSGKERRLDLQVGEQPSNFSTHGGVRNPVDDERQPVRRDDDIAGR